MFSRVNYSLSRCQIWCVKSLLTTQRRWRRRRMILMVHKTMMFDVQRRIERWHFSSKNHADVDAKNIDIIVLSLMIFCYALTLIFIWCIKLFITYWEITVDKTTRAHKKLAWSHIQCLEFSLSNIVFLQTSRCYVIYNCIVFH